MINNSHINNNENNFSNNYNKYINERINKILNNNSTNNRSAYNNIINNNYSSNNNNEHLNIINNKSSTNHYTDYLNKIRDYDIHRTEENKNVNNKLYDMEENIINNYNLYDHILQTDIGINNLLKKDNIKGNKNDMRFTYENLNTEEKIDYKLIEESGPDHNKTFVVEVCLNSNVIGKGIGKSKKEAEQMAAQEALALMGYEET